VAIQHLTTHGRGNVFYAIVACAGLILPLSQGAAQQAADSGDKAVEEIIVTGSRITRRDENAPSPIVTVGADFIENTGVLNLEAALNDLPQFTRDSTGGQGTGGRALMDLRGLGSSRNLILLDGRRLPISAANGVVDTNAIPPAIVENVEIITGGASAVYGSDAVSGVVNFRTGSNFEGVRVDAQFGDTMDGISPGYTTSAAIGGHFDDGNGYALLSLNFTEQDALWGRDRADFFALGIPSSYIGQGTYVASATNLPDQAVVDTLFAGYGTASTSSNNRFGFNDNGSLFGQNSGAANYQGPINLDYQVLGGNVRMPVLIQGTQRPSVDRKSIFSKMEYGIGNDMTAYGQILYTDHTTNTNSGGTLTQFGTPRIPITNPFIPADLATLLASRPNPTEDFDYNSRYVMLPAKNWDENYITQQLITGLRGEFGDGWTWDAYAAWDSATHNQQQNSAVFLSRVQTLFSAADGGDSICEGGYNPFGLANVMAMSEACKNYISGATHSVERLTRRAFEGIVSGTLFELPAGDVRAAFSADYREDTYSFSPDKALAEQDVQAVIAEAPASGSIDVTELAAEFEIPVFETFSLGAAFRYSDYNLSGGTNTYKLDGMWRPTDKFLFRAGFQRAIRAPNINELFAAGKGGQVGFGDPTNDPNSGEPCDIRTGARMNDTSGNLRQLCIDMGIPAGIVDTYIFPTTATAGLTSGNIGLTPEEADTLTFGAVYTTEIGDRSNLFASVDYFDIDIADVISVVPGLTALNKCHNIDGSNPSYDPNNPFCQLISRDSNGALDLIRTPFFNLGGLATSGIDFVVNLDTETDFGDFSADTAITYVTSYEIQTLPGEAFVDEVGTIQFFGIPRPKLSAITTFGYRRGDLDLALRWRFIDSMDDRSILNNPNTTTPGVDSYSKFDLIGRYSFNEELSVRVGITNLTDKDPLVVGGVPGITDTQTYDIVGRSWFLGATYDF